MMDEQTLNGGRARSTHRLDDIEPFFSSDMGESPLVMVIDDSPAVRRVVEFSLFRVGIPCVSYADGLQAIAALQNGEVEPPRVLLLDIALPRINGHELARLFRSNPAFQDTRIIMLSGNDGVVNRAYSRLSGASDFIAKPFKSQDFVHRMRVALGLEWPMD